MAIFIPAILEPTAANVNQLFSQLVGLVDRVQLDFADNSLVANRTALPSELTAFPTNLEVDAHLMVDQPQLYLIQLKELGAKRLVIHLESPVDLSALIDQINGHRFGLGLTLNPTTPIANLDPYIHQVEFVQIMAIQPGFGNQPFLAESYDRIKQLKARYPQVKIAVDGGVRLTNAQTVVMAGADYLVVGKGGFAAKGGIVAGIHQWQQALQGM